MKSEDEKELHRYRVGNSMLAASSGATLLVAELAKWINPEWITYGALTGFVLGLYIGWKSGNSISNKNDRKI